MENFRSSIPLEIADWIYYELLSAIKPNLMSEYILNILDLLNLDRNIDIDELTIGQIKGHIRKAIHALYVIIDPSDSLEIHRQAFLPQRLDDSEILEILTLFRNELDKRNANTREYKCLNNLIKCI